MSFAEKRRKNIEFVLIVMSIFVPGFILYGMLGSMQWTTLWGLLGGLYLSGCYCGAYLLIEFLKNKPLVIKVICAFLAPFTMVIAMLCGVVALVPLFVVKIVQIIKYRKADEEIPPESTQESDAELLEVVEESEPPVKKRKNNEVIIAVVVFVVLALLAAVGGMALKNYMDEASNLEEYTINDYSVTAITKVVGERRVSGIASNFSRTESSKTYTYSASENVIEDIEAYVNHLIDNEAFRMGQNEGGRVSVYKYVEDGDRLDVEMTFDRSRYMIVIKFTDR